MSFDEYGEKRSMGDERIRLGPMSEYLIAEAKAGELKQAEMRVDSAEEEISQAVRTSRFVGFGQVTSGVAAAQFGNFRATHGVLWKAHNGNTGIIYIGVSPGVAAAGGRGMGGFELGPGDAVWLPILELGDWWHVASAADQLMSVVGV